MEKQIVIKHSSNDTKTKIHNIMRFLDIFISRNSLIVCNFCLYEDCLVSLDEINDIKSATVQKNLKKSICKKEYLDIELSIHYDDIIIFLQIVEKYDLNTVMYYKDIMICLNDNDGDFIVINSKDMLYPKIKEISKYSLN